jgi:hypothetical protein
MKLFTLDQDGNLNPYLEKPFKDENRESHLEDILEKNPEYFFEDSKILMIGRQVPTNLNTTIDLLGIDKVGNLVVIELKREKTPRETIAQLLEYASFVENLDYFQLNDIFQKYIDQETSLDSYHQAYFDLFPDDNVAFNKSVKLVIVAQDITPPIKQTAMYLRKKAIDIYCLEFKYFQSKKTDRMITCDFIVGDDSYLMIEIRPAVTLPKTNEKTFLECLDDNGKMVFSKILAYAKQMEMPIRWGSKGFSINQPLSTGQVAIIFGYPLTSAYKQCINPAFEEINKKVKNPQPIIDYFKDQLQKSQMFSSSQGYHKLFINRALSTTEIDQFITILGKVAQMIKDADSTNE